MAAGGPPSQQAKWSSPSRLPGSAAARCILAVDLDCLPRLACPAQSPGTSHTGLSRQLRLAQAAPVQLALTLLTSSAPPPLPIPRHPSVTAPIISREASSPPHSARSPPPPGQGGLVPCLPAPPWPCRELARAATLAMSCFGVTLHSRRHRQRPPPCDRYIASRPAQSALVPRCR